MNAISHQLIQTNNITMHVALQGEGPLIVLCHGFPEGWYSWRHQLPALAAAGFRVVAPDQRGYGQTDKPEAIEAYDIANLTADIVGLVHALGEQKAIIVGHDWGAVVAWHCALLRPDLFHALGLLSVPFRRRSWNDPRPTDLMKTISGEGQFYQLYFQQPGKAEAELQEDVRKSITMFLYAASGDAPPEKRWRFLFGKEERLLDSGGIPDTLPSWLKTADIDYFTEQFTQGGFRGPLNWYRNLDRMWETTPFLCGATIRQPSLFVAGDLDAVITMYQPAYLAMEKTMPGLRKKVLLPGVGHWVQQERPTEVNRLLLEFLQGLQG